MKIITENAWFLDSTVGLGFCIVYTEIFDAIRNQ